MEIIELNDDAMDLLKVVAELGLTPDEAIARLKAYDDPVDDDFSAMLETLD